MLIKVTKGSDPHKLASYLLRPDKQKADKPPEIDTNMVGANALELAEEFRFSHTLNPRVQQTMAHYSVSLAPEERVQPETRREISRRILEETGHSDCMYLSVEHHDQSHKNDVQHWHIATSNVDLDGNHIEDDFIRVKLRGIERSLEQEFGLQPTRVRAEEERKNLTTGEYRLKERTQRTLPKERLWRAIDQAASDQPSMSLLVARLRVEDISVRLRQQNGQTTGVSYEVDGIAFPGYKLGKAYSFNGLQKHLGVNYLPEQDSQLQELSQMSPQETKALIEEQDAHQRHYDDLYQRYSPQINLSPEERDRYVVRRAIADRMDPDEAAAIIGWSSEQADSIKRTQGKDAAANYALALTQDEWRLARQRAQQTRERDRGLER